MRTHTVIVPANQPMMQSGKRAGDAGKRDWVVDLDIKAFFDSIDHELMMNALEKHTDERWVLLYVKRWLEAPVQLADGSLEQRLVDTPQGGVASPLLANLFLHYAFDCWMRRNQPDILFERYADDSAPRRRIGVCN